MKKILTSKWTWGALVVLIALAAFSPSEGGDKADDTTSTSTSTTAVERARIDPADAPALEAAVAAIYPGVPEGKAFTWADYTCADLADGTADAERVAARFAGGTRPDPTPEQAAAIFEVIAEYCPV